MLLAGVFAFISVAARRADLSKIPRGKVPFIIWTQRLLDVLHIARWMKVSILSSIWASLERS